MNEQYVTLVGKVCAPRYENVFTPEVKSKLPIEATSEGRKLKDWGLYGNNNPNRIDETQDTLPYAVTAYGGDATDWEIYGNNNPVVENKTSILPIDVSATAGNLLDYTIYGNNNIGKNKLEITEDTTTKYDVTFTVNLDDGSIVATGTCSSSSANQAQFNFQGSSQLPISDGLISDGMIISCENLIAGTRFALVYYDTNGTYISEQICDSTNSSQVISIPSNAVYYRFYVRKTATAGNTTVTFKPMLRLANTTSTFEPYMVGVGERTKNWLDLSKYTYSSGISNVVIDAATGALSFTGTGTNRGVNFIAADLGVEMYGKTYTVSCVNNLASTTTGKLAIRKRTTNAIFRSISLSTTGEKSITFTPDEETFPDGWYISVLATGSTSETGYSDISQLMLVEGDTTADFIPYGYQIPMQVKQRTKNFYNITNAYSLKAGVTVQEEDGRLHIFGNSTNNANHVIAVMVGSLLTKISLEAGQYVLSGAVANTNSNYRIQLLYINPDDSAGAIIGYDDGNGLEFTLEEPSTVYMRIYVKAAAYQQDVDLLFSPMIRRADTSSDFEPYYNINQTDIYIGNSPLIQGQSITKAQSGQDITLFSGDNIIDTGLYNKPNTSITYNSSVLGVGERTSNLYDRNAADTTKGYVLNKYLKDDGSTGDNSSWIISEYINISGGSQIYLTYTDETTTSVNASVAFYNSNHTFISGVKYNSQIAVSAPIPTNAKYCRFSILKANSGVAVLSLVSFSSYVPFGYQIPLSVTSGQTTTPYNYYIGNSPLTAGQSISKTSTGTDIALLSGTNTISTTLGNKPEVRIDYESAEVGVGAQTKNLISVPSRAPVTDHGVTFTSDPVAGTITANGTAVGGQGRYAIYIEPSETINVYLSGCPAGGSSSSYNVYPWDSTAGARPKKWDGVTTQTNSDYGNGDLEVQVPAGHRVSITIRIEQGYTANNLVFKPMFRKADTTSEFEPYGYKIPVKVKERTKNYVTWDNVDDTQYNVHCFGENGYLRLVGNYDSDGVHQPFRAYFTLPAGSYVLSGAPDYDTLPIRLAMCTYVGSVANYTTIGYDQGDGLSFTLSEDSNCFVGVRLQSGVIGVPIDLTLPCMVRKSDTSSDFEPYYSNATQTDIYIGNQPLVSGASVNKDGTGIEIELNEGMNQITTDSYNEPEMYIK